MTNTNDSGAGSLRDAIAQANANANFPILDTINFLIPGVGVQTINVGALSFKSITEQVLIDGATQPGYGPGGAPLIALNGAAAPNHALYLNGANRVLAAQAAYADTGVVPELLAIYHLLADPGMRIRQDQRESGGRRIRGPSG